VLSGTVESRLSGSEPIQPDFLDTVRRALADRYDVQDEIGRGGMATVFRATSRFDGREVALKVLDPRLGMVLGHDRFRREIATLSRLEHPSILPQLDSGESHGLLFFAMPLIKGGTLRGRLVHEPQLPIEDALSITHAVLAALDYAHRHNVIHRDIKPENILLEDGQPLIADFGIARAIVRSGGDQISTTGLAMGTAAYMSPEQGTGETRLDGRTDIYSTGCVLYEMLVGGPPFSGPTPQAVQARHLLEPPPPLRVVRPAVSEALQAVVEKSLAKVPADRFRSASEFAAALDQALKTGALPYRTRRRWRRALWLGAALLVATAGAVRVLRTPGPIVDPERYIVLPFRHRSSDQPGPISADNSTRLLWQSLSRWRDLRLVDQDVVEDRIRRIGDSLPTLSGELNLARALGAGLLVLGEVFALGDSISVRASVFEARGRVADPIRRAEFTLPRSAASDTGSASQLIRRFAELARSLILPSLEGVGDPGEPTGTPYYRAFRATLSGDSALLRWNLDLARERYRQALSVDPSYAAPSLRFARASLWMDAPVSEWRPAAEAALRTASQLAPVEQLEAQGLAALGRDDFPRACDRFGEILKRDSLSFTGWYGIGECLTRDDIVVPDPASPSKWRYRGGYSSGIAAYRRALTLVPLAHAAFGGAALSRLAAKLVVQPNFPRLGVALSDSLRRFAAYPELLHDSVAYVPYPMEEITKGSRFVRTQGQALALNRRTLLLITSEWLGRYPASVPAISAHAQALELTGDIGSSLPGEPSALMLVRQLRTRDSRSGRDIGLAAWEVRLRLKARQFTVARMVAESALAVSPKTAEEGVTQAGLAALTGRIYLAADLVGRFADWPFATPDGRFVETPKTVGAIANRLLVYAAFGTPEDSIHVLTSRLRVEVESRVDPTQRAAVMEALMFQPSLLGYPVLPPPSDQQFPTARVEKALAGGDRVAARREFDALGNVRRFQLPGDITLDHAVLEARLFRFLGDTVAARARLEPFLDDPGTLGTDVLEFVTQAAAVGRAMQLYLGLIGKAGIRGIDTALVALWRHADGELRSWQPQ
jgi:serine/threonine protein kinase